MKTVLITRPLGEAEPLAEALRARGLHPFVEPLLAIKPLPENKPALEAAFARRPQRILATSQRAIRLLSKMASMRAIPLSVVGQESARHAMELGFTDVSASETAETLIASVIDSMPAHAPLLYVRGEDITTDVKGALEEKGFAVDEVILYRAIPVQELSARLQAKLAQHEIAAALFFSRRTAETYAKLVKAGGLEETHSTIHAVCISETVAAQLSHLPWHSHTIAQKPNMKHILKAL